MECARNGPSFRAFRDPKTFIMGVLPQASECGVPQFRINFCIQNAKFIDFCESLRHCADVLREAGAIARAKYGEEDMTSKSRLLASLLGAGLCFGAGAPVFAQSVKVEFPGQARPH